MCVRRSAIRSMRYSFLLSCFFVSLSVEARPRLVVSMRGRSTGIWSIIELARPSSPYLNAKCRITCASNAIAFRGEPLFGRKVSRGRARRNPPRIVYAMLNQTLRRRAEFGKLAFAHDHYHDHAFHFSGPGPLSERLLWIYDRPLLVFCMHLDCQGWRADRFL